MAAFLAALLVAAVTFDGAAAEADRARFNQADWPYLYWATTAPIPEEGRQSAAVALKLAVASAAPSPVIEYCTPVEVTPTLFRIDTRSAGFHLPSWQKIVARDPYRTAALPMMTRADWLTVEISDAHENPDAYYPLVFGGRTPRNRKEALAMLGVDDQPANLFGMIEGRSGVAEQGTRWLQNNAILRGYAYGTKDVLSLAAHQDPLEQPEGDFAFDGQEWIIGRRKFSIATGAQGALQVYLLFNAAENRVDRAPVDLVRDHTEFRGLAEIRNPGSCIQCHTRGLNPPTLNEFRAEILAGVDRYADPKQQQAIDIFHGPDFATSIRRDNDLYYVACQLATGHSPTEAASYFALAVSRYDEPVTLEQAASELYTTPARLQQALALTSTFGGKPTTRLAGLAHGRTIPREAWEQAYYPIWRAVKQWEPPK